MPSRRAILRGAAALPALALAAPAVLGAGRARATAGAGGDPWAAVADRARAFDQLHSIVVGHKGRIVLAEAFRGPSLETPVNVKSVSKTLVASLVGQALARGVLPGGVPDGADRTLGDLAPGLIPPGAAPEVADIRLADFLSLQGGLERTSGPNYGAWVASDDWLRHALTRPLVARPGGRFLYSTGNFHILGAVLAEAAGRSLHALAQDWLGDPLGLALPPWTRDPQGRYLGGNNMAVSPLGLWRFGEMCRLGGVWRGDGEGAEGGRGRGAQPEEAAAGSEGERGDASAAAGEPPKRVLPAAWLQASWRPRTVSPFSGHAYGYGWFLARIAGGPGGEGSARAPGARRPGAALTAATTPETVEVAYARGYGGQMLYLVPNAELVVAITSDPTRPARSAGYAGELNGLLVTMLNAEAR